MGKRRKYLPIGQFSSDTLVAADVLERAIDISREVEMSAENRRIIIEARSAMNNAKADEDLSDHLDAVLDVLDTYAPPLCYVGTHEGDGACFGVWPQIEPGSYDESTVGRGPSLPRAFDHQNLDYFLVVNDHGNAALYQRTRSHRWILLWDIV